MERIADDLIHAIRDLRNWLEHIYEQRRAYPMARLDNDFIYCLDLKKEIFDVLKNNYPSAVNDERPEKIVGADQSRNSV